MGRNHEVTERHPLLDGNGELIEPGWSRSLVQEYDRKMIKAPKFRIKEWDYYLVMGQGFAGLSLGSMATYRAAFYNNFDLFAWYGPFSGCGGPFGDHDNEAKRICETLMNGEEKGLELKYMFCCNGDKDIAYAEHTDIMGKVIAVCPQLKKGVNYDFFTIPGGVHDMKAWQLDLYHALQIFFK